MSFHNAIFVETPVPIGKKLGESIFASFYLDEFFISKIICNTQKQSLSMCVAWHCADGAQFFSYWSKLAAPGFLQTIKLLTVQLRVKSLAIGEPLIEDEQNLSDGPGLATVCAYTKWKILLL